MCKRKSFTPKSGVLHTTQKGQETDSATQPDPAADETQNWISFSSSKGWTLKIPDGWELYTDATATGLTAYTPLEYKLARGLW